jgi:hypothetical protein
MEKCANILQAIKDHKGKDGRKKWTKLNLKNVWKDYKKLVDDILANHEGILSLSFQQEWAREGGLISAVDNLKEIRFKFPNDNAHRSYNDFTPVHLLETYWNDTEDHITKLIEFLKLCTNLKVLKVATGKITISSIIMELILSAAKSIEELHLDISSSEDPSVSIDAFEVVKSSAKNLKKFIVKVDPLNAENARKKIKIFNSSKIQTIVFEVDDDRELEPWESMDEAKATCIWKK